MNGTIVVAPHPDDEVLGASAVLASHQVTVVHVTDGVPPWVEPPERAAVRSTRSAECQRAWQVLEARVDHVQLSFPDLGSWRGVEEVACALQEIVAAHRPRRIFVPAYQRGHPDHDATFLAGALAAERLADPDHDWRVYGLYGFDRGRRLRFGWIPADRFAGREERGEQALLAVKAEALRQFTSQLWPSSALDRWLSKPRPEYFAPLPPRWRRTPDLPSFYDEQLGFARYGAGADTVEAVFGPVLSVPQTPLRPVPAAAR